MGRRRIFFVLHAVLAITALALISALATSKGGHPPAIVLLPVAMVAWVLGHGFLWIINRTLRRLPSLGGERGGKRWPLPILFVFIASGGLLFTLLNGLGWSLSQSVEAISVKRSLWSFSLVGATALVFLGILLRRPWGRFGIAAVSASFSAFVFFRVALATAAGSLSDPDDWLAAVLMVGTSAGLAVYFLRAKESHAFFGHPRG